MGVDYTAYAAIGVRIRCHDAMVATKRRVCHHGAVEGATYCPVCGKPMWEATKALRPELAALREAWEGLNNCGDDRLVILKTACERSDYIITSRVAKADDSEGAGMCPLVADLVLQKERLRGFLEPLGLWREGDFGLWAVQYVSY